MFNLSESLKDKLKANWGEKAEALEVIAWVKLIDPSCPFRVYILAMNPDDEEEIFCLFDAQATKTDYWLLSALNEYFNWNGEGLEIDTEYRPRKAIDLFKKLRINNG